uniref:Uncharacterized protein n=1 Tax=Arundo donax TaxID=35708 RepID=A0A0A8Z4Y6_ARUDO
MDVACGLVSIPDENHGTHDN